MATKFATSADEGPYGARVAEEDRKATAADKASTSSPTGKVSSEGGSSSTVNANQSTGGTQSTSNNSSTSGRQSEVFNQTQTTDSNTTRNVDENTVRQVDTQNMTPEAQASLQILIQQLQDGGTTEQRRAKDNRNQTEALIQGLLGAVSPDQALEDAKGLMALNLQQSMEKNMPAIQRAIEGAGTSASSMQGLLSQALARDSALAASALGAGQQAQYAQQRSNLASVLENISRENNTVTASLLDALDIAKGAVSSTQETIGKTTSDITNTNGTVTTTGTRVTDSSSATSGNSNTVSSGSQSGSTTTTKSPTEVIDSYLFNGNNNNGATNSNNLPDNSGALAPMANSQITSGFVQFDPNSGAASGTSGIYKNQYGVYSDSANRN